MINLLILGSLSCPSCHSLWVMQEAVMSFNKLGFGVKYEMKKDDKKTIQSLEKSGVLQPKPYEGSPTTVVVLDSSEKNQVPQ